MRIGITAIGSISAEHVISRLKADSAHYIHGFDIYPQEWLYSSNLVHSFEQIIPSSEPMYIEGLLNSCQQKKLDALIPLTDPEVDLIANFHEQFININCTPLIPNARAIEVCRNKLAFYNQFKDSPFIDVIPTFEDVKDILQTSDTMFVRKPINGRSSQGFLKFSKDSVPMMESEHKMIYQPYITGNIITVDCLRDYFGTVVAVPRMEFLRTANGAGLTVKTLMDNRLQSNVRHIMETLNIVGLINIEFIQHNNTLLLMDMNPRASAGIRFSFAAGYDFVQNLVRCFNNLPIAAFNLVSEQIFTTRFQTG